MPAIHRKIGAKQEAKSAIDGSLSFFFAQVNESLPPKNKALKNRALEIEAEMQGILAKAQRYTEQLELLMEFSSILNSSLDSMRVSELAMKCTCKLLDCEGAMLYLVDQAKNELQFEAIVGKVSPHQLNECKITINSNSSAGQAALTKETVVQNASFPKGKRKDRNPGSTKTLLCVPIVARGKVLGVLQAIDSKRSHFDAADVRLLESLAHQVSHSLENAQLYESLKNQFIETAMAMASAIDAKDKYTGGHTKRVSQFSQLIAKHMGLTREEIEEVRLSAILHDIGKIGIEDQILKKESPLTKEEWERMKAHPQLGYQILKPVKNLQKISDGLRFHHERMDGHGYPLGLRGQEIPLIARIISVADTFDAMTSDRPYRKGLSYDDAFEEILRCRGTQFDEKVVDAFIKAFNIERMGKKKDC